MGSDLRGDHPHPHALAQRGHVRTKHTLRAEASTFTFEGNGCPRFMPASCALQFWRLQQTNVAPLTMVLLGPEVSLLAILGD